MEKGRRKWVKTIITWRLNDTKKEARQVNQKFLKRGNIGITNMHKSTGDKIGIPDGWVI